MLCLNCACFLYWHKDRTCLKYLNSSMFNFLQPSFQIVYKNRNGTRKQVRRQIFDIFHISLSNTIKPISPLIKPGRRQPLATEHLSPSLDVAAQRGALPQCSRDSAAPPRFPGAEGFVSENTGPPYWPGAFGIHP